MGPISKKLNLPGLRKKNKQDDSFQCFDDSSYVSGVSGNGLLACSSSNENDGGPSMDMSNRFEEPPASAAALAPVAEQLDLNSLAHTRSKKPNMLKRMGNKMRHPSPGPSRTIADESKDEPMENAFPSDQHEASSSPSQSGLGERPRMLTAPSDSSLSIGHLMNDNNKEATPDKDENQSQFQPRRSRTLSAPSGEGLVELAMHASTGNVRTSMHSSQGAIDELQQRPLEEKKSQHNRSSRTSSSRPRTVLPAPSNEDLCNVMHLHSSTSGCGISGEAHLSPRHTARRATSFDGEDVSSSKHKSSPGGTSSTPRRSQRRPLGMSSSFSDDTMSVQPDSSVAPTIRSRKGRRKRPEGLSGSGSSGSSSKPESLSGASNMERFLTLSKQRSGRGLQDAHTVNIEPSKTNAGGGRRLRQSTRASGGESVVGDRDRSSRRRGTRSSSLERKGGVSGASPLARSTSNARPRTPSRKGSSSRSTTPTKSKGSEPRPRSKSRSKSNPKSRPEDENEDMPPKSPKSPKSPRSSSVHKHRPRTPSRKSSSTDERRSSSRSRSVLTDSPSQRKSPRASSTCRHSRGEGSERRSRRTRPLSPESSPVKRRESIGSVNIASPSAAVDRVMQLLEETKPKMNRKTDSKNESAGSNKQTYSFRLSPNKNEHVDKASSNSDSQPPSAEDDNREQIVVERKNGNTAVVPDPVISSSSELDPNEAGEGGRSTPTEGAPEPVERSAKRSPQSSSGKTRSQSRAKSRSGTLSKLDQHPHTHRKSPTSVASVAQFEPEPPRKASTRTRRRSLDGKTSTTTASGGGGFCMQKPTKSRPRGPPHLHATKAPTTNDSVVPFEAEDDKGDGEVIPFRAEKESRTRSGGESINTRPSNSSSSRRHPSRQKPRSESRQKARSESRQKPRSSDGSTMSLSSKLASSSRPPRSSKTPRSDGSVVAAQLSFLPGATEKGLAVQYEDMESVISESWKQKK